MTTNFFFTCLFYCCFWIRDPGWVKIRIRDKLVSLFSTCWNAPGDAEENDPVPLLEGPLGTPLPRPVVHSQHLGLTQQIQLCLLLLHTILTL